MFTNTLYLVAWPNGLGYSDASGNLTVRDKGLSTQQTLTWSHENRLASLTATGLNESYLYDADGIRVKKVSGSTTTYYPFPHYEVSNGVVTKYYFFNGQRVAMRQNGVLYYLHPEHLGGNLFATNTGGTKSSVQGYYAYGKTRWGNLQTDHRFTGQKYDNTGLYYFNARYYDPAIGTFISPDTFVPDPTNIWEYNRFGYARLNPMKYNDPTGHWVETLWDAANIAWGTASLVHNVSEGKWGDAAWDVGGLLVDSAATIVPLIPGGAAATLKAGRALDKAVDTVKTVQRAGNAFEAVRVGGELVQTSTLLARHFERAAEFGIRSASELK